MTCAELQALKSQTEADLARAQVERDSAELDKDAAQVDLDAANAAVMIAMNELGTKNIVLAQKQAEVDSKTMTLQYVNMMIQMQGC